MNFESFWRFAIFTRWPSKSPIRVVLEVFKNWKQSVGGGLIYLSEFGCIRAFGLFLDICKFSKVFVDWASSHYAVLIPLFECCLKALDSELQQWIEKAAFYVTSELDSIRPFGSFPDQLKFWEVFWQFSIFAHCSFKSFVSVSVDGFWMYISVVDRGSLSLLEEKIWLHLSIWFFARIFELRKVN